MTPPEKPLWKRWRLGGHVYATCPGSSSSMADWNRAVCTPHPSWDNLQLLWNQCGIGSLRVCVSWGEPICYVASCLGLVLWPTKSHVQANITEKRKYWVSEGIWSAKIRMGADIQKKAKKSSRGAPGFTEHDSQADSLPVLILSSHELEWVVFTWIFSVLKNKPT